jgi:molybdenum cofactor cytidylyltransferase
MISAIILAAGASRRMGQPKMLLPWRDSTVLEHVISVFQNADLEEILVVTGGAREMVEDLLMDIPVRTVHNKEYETGEMLSSIQCGIRALTGRTNAVLIGLGDQPQVQEGTVKKVCKSFQDSGANIVLPSFQMRRGHPWLVAQPLWNELLMMEFPQSPRDFLNAHAADILYVDVDDPNILADLDTPEDYRKWHV